MNITRKRAKAIASAIVGLRNVITDEQAVTVIDLYPSWETEKQYNPGDRVVYGGTLYKTLQAHTSSDSWIPDAAPSLFAKILIPDADQIPAWEQPDSTNPYMIGDKVTHNSKTWECAVDNNVWEPGVYGWIEI